MPASTPPSATAATASSAKSTPNTPPTATARWRNEHLHASSRRTPIGVKIVGPLFDTDVFWAAREDDAGGQILIGAGGQWQAVGSRLGVAKRRDAEAGARRPGVSGGFGQAGRDLEFVNERLEQ